MSLTQLIVEGLSGASVATTNGMPACVYIRYMYTQAVHQRTIETRVCTLYIHGSF